MALSATAVRNAKPRAKPYKMGDSLGLFLLVETCASANYWARELIALGLRRSDMRVDCRSA
jgi:hypothetical protein